MRLAVVCLLFVLCLALAGASGWMLSQTQSHPAASPEAVAPKGTEPLDLDHLALGQRGTICQRATTLDVLAVCDDTILIVRQVSKRRWTDQEINEHLARTSVLYTPTLADLEQTPDGAKVAQEMRDRIHVEFGSPVAIKGVSIRGIVDGATIRLRHKFEVVDTYTWKHPLNYKRIFLLEPCN